MGAEGELRGVGEEDGGARHGISASGTDADGRWTSRGGTRLGAWIRTAEWLEAVEINGHFFSAPSAADPQKQVHRERALELVSRRSQHLLGTDPVALYHPPAGG